jgi:hypothetical protein
MHGLTGLSDLQSMPSLAVALTALIAALRDERITLSLVAEGQISVDGH